MPAWLQNRRNQYFLVALVVVIVVIVLVVVSTSGGGTPTSSPSVLPSVPSPTPSVSPTTAPKHLLVFNGRDPFQQLFAPTVVASPTSSSSPGPTPSVSPGGSSPPQAPSGGSSTSIGGHSVVLLDISSGNRVQVQVDGKVYFVNPGQTFDKNFKYTGVTAGCANFLYGDQAFTLCPTANK